MNACIYTQSNWVRNNYVNSLIPRGISLYHVEHGETLIEKILSTRSEIAILDVIQEDYDAIFALIRQIKSHESEIVKGASIILIIGSVDKTHVTSAIALGVKGFIKSNAEEDFVGNYIIEIYKKDKGAPPERKFVRVSFDTSNPNERIGIKFRSPINSQLIMGLIKDISFGGIAVELVGTFPKESLAAGVAVKNMQFILDGKDVYVDGVVVAYQRMFCAFRFVNMSETVSEIISHYIFQRISTITAEVQPPAAASEADQPQTPPPPPQPEEPGGEEKKEGR
jgi:CheY-like chemotaxis protein